LLVRGLVLAMAAPETRPSDAAGVMAFLLHRLVIVPCPPFPIHLDAAAARALRRGRLEVVRPAAEPVVEQRPLADYDIALGLVSGAAR